jgi:transposase
LDNLIVELDRCNAIRLHQTPGVYLLSIQGISAIRTAEFIAEIGNPYKYHHHKELVKLAGLNASRYQSGTMDRKNNPITKTGNSYLRETLFATARDIARWEPLFIDLKNRLCARGKHIQVAYGAIANKFLRVAFSMMLRKSNFIPDYEKKGEKMPDQ